MAKVQRFDSFEDLINQTKKPLLVDFYATWCGPCRMLAPILDQVRLLLDGRIKIAKIDTDRYPEIASKFQVHALPTVVLFKDGVPVHRLEGVVPAEKIIDQISPFL